MWMVSPEIVDPLCVIVFDTITPIKTGSGPGGGGGLLPGSVVQSVPHAGGVPAVAAKPLNAAGAAPPPNVLRLLQLELQKVTSVPMAALPLPITNAPDARKPNTVTVRAWWPMSTPSATARMSKE